ncbi:Agamous-like MADS-box protein AGL3 [Striga hermonthica]|uniref:Agamous-like MADS-box protein AGL3 n=1 Tax=Striga hermonthica TaxID=68872 RepID=A0A9N7RLB1_STRHE|nr:Agamous-like MADS-box protein AGL3 [Striga hermonthica]
MKENLLTAELSSKTSGKQLSALDGTTITSLAEILQRYHRHFEKEPSPSTEAHESQAEVSKYSKFLTCGELLQITEGELGESFLEQLSVTDLLHLEKQLEAALIQTRTTKTDMLLASITNLHEEEKMLAEEKRVLQEKIAGGSCSKSNKAMMLIDLNVVPPDDNQTQNQSKT